MASSFRFPLPASPRITRPTIVADSSKSRYRKGCRRALARESNPQTRIVAMYFVHWPETTFAEVRMAATVRRLTAQAQSPEPDFRIASAGGPKQSPSGA